MPDQPDPRGDGTLVVAALLVLGLVFASYWILSAVSPSGGHPLAPWFGVAAAAILAVAFVLYVRRT
ncbi:MAG: hypothetical protein ACREQL_03810 [Candidatus Binatia bacterium]